MSSTPVLCNRGVYQAQPRPHTLNHHLLLYVFFLQALSCKSCQLTCLELCGSWLTNSQSKWPGLDHACFILYRVEYIDLVSLGPCILYDVKNIDLVSLEPCMLYGVEYIDLVSLEPCILYGVKYIDLVSVVSYPLTIRTLAWSMPHRICMVLHIDLVSLLPPCMPRRARTDILLLLLYFRVEYIDLGSLL